MNILILGGTGSIGQALTELLKNTAWNVYVTTRTKRENVQNITFLQGNAHDTVFAEGINKCLKQFIESPEWRNINWKLNFWMDNITGEKTKIWDADGLKEKARYVKYCIKK